MEIVESQCTCIISYYVIITTKEIACNMAKQKVCEEFKLVRLYTAVQFISRNKFDNTVGAVR